MLCSGDELIFAAETADEESAQGHAAEPWRVLVVDDDPDVFRVTELSLKRLRFRDRAVQLLTASSAAVARAQLDRDRGIALALIDVVMETETAGLELIRTIRGELGLNDMRIILRTGQPGQAPRARCHSELRHRWLRRQGGNDRDEAVHDRRGSVARL